MADALLSSHGHVAKKRNEMLKRERAKQVRENKLRLDALFVEFDTDKTGTLDKEQLKKLLLKLHSEASTVSDETLDKLLKLGEASGGISRASMQKVIDTYAEYARQQGFIDAAF